MKISNAPAFVAERNTRCFEVRLEHPRRLFAVLRNMERLGFGRQRHQDDPQSVHKGRTKGDGVLPPMFAVRRFQRHCGRVQVEGTPG
jgi:hypothetical protein